MCRALAVVDQSWEMIYSAAPIYPTAEFGVIKSKTKKETGLIWTPLTI